MPAAGTSPKPACFFGHRISVLHHFLLPSRSSCALHAERRAGGFAELPFPGISPFPEKPTPSAVVGMLIKPSQGHAGRHSSLCGKVARMRDLLSPSPQTGLFTGHGYVPKVAEKSNSFGIKPRRPTAAPAAVIAAQHSCNHCHQRAWGCRSHRGVTSPVHDAVHQRLLRTFFSVQLGADKG